MIQHDINILASPAKSNALSNDVLATTSSLPLTEKYTNHKFVISESRFSLF